MNTDLRKTLTITVSNNRKVRLLFIRPTDTSNWVCQATDECLIDLIHLFDEESKDD